MTTHLTFDDLTFDDLSAMTTEEVIREMNAAAAHTAQGLLRLSRAFTVLIERGVNVAAFRVPFAGHLALVAAGRLSPDLLLRFGHSPSVLTAASTLVPEEQARLLTDGGNVKVLRDDGVTIDHQPLDELTIPKIRQVIGDGCVRSPEQQRGHVPRRRQEPQRQEPQRQGQNVPEDPWAEMHPRNLAALRRAATRRGISPMKLIEQWLVQLNKLPGAPAAITAQTRRELQTALRRPAGSEATV